MRPTVSTASKAAESRGQNAASQVSQANDLRKVYRNQEAIRNVSLSVAANEFVSILGPSVCGKSTLLMMIADLITESVVHGRGKNRIEPSMERM
jgi:ABC-type sugar transport system ATPase subunit